MVNPRLAAQLLLSKRILVLGSSGSGKTYLARQLGKILNIEPIHLDAHFIKPGWTATPQDEWRKTLSSLIQKEYWIMDGTYERTLDLRLPAADTVIVIESSRLICLWRVVKRKLTVDDAHRPDAPPGQRLDWPFLRSIWLYPTVSRPAVYKAIQEYGQDKRLIILKGSKGIGQLLKYTQVHIRETGE